MSYVVLIRPQDNPVNGVSLTSPYVANFLRSFAEFLMTELSTDDIIFITTEHFCSFPDINFSGGINPSPDQRRYSCVPYTIIEDQKNILQKYSKGKEKLTFILSSYCWVDFSKHKFIYYQIGEKWKIFNRGEFSINPFNKAFFDPYKTIQDALGKDSSFLSINLSTFINNGERKYHIKTFQAGCYISRGCDVLDAAQFSNSNPDLYDNYLSKIDPLYLNGGPQDFLEIKNAKFFHSICADAIAGVWNHSVMKETEGQKIPIIIQGDSMSPSWFFQNVMRPYCFNNGLSFSTTGLNVNNTANFSDYPPKIYLTLMNQNVFPPAPLNLEEVKGFDRKAHQLLKILISSAPLIFADVSLDTGYNQIGGVYKGCWDQSKNAFLFSKQQSQVNPSVFESWQFREDFNLKFGTPNSHPGVWYSVYNV